MSLRQAITWFTLVCFVTTRTASLAGPHEEGVAAGQAANPIARGSVTTSSATDVVPGYTTTPTEATYYRQPDLAGQGGARLAACTSLPNDPTCQAQRGALASANAGGARLRSPARPSPAVNRSSLPRCSLRSSLLNMEDSTDLDAGPLAHDARPNPTMRPQAARRREVVMSPH